MASKRKKNELFYRNPGKLERRDLTTQENAKGVREKVLGGMGDLMSFSL